MEKKETITRTVEETTHHFYCDDCNKYLGKTEEYDDGYYPQLGQFDLKFHIPKGWFEVEKHLCDDCKEKFLTKVENTLLGLGFKKQ